MLVIYSIKFKPNLNHLGGCEVNEKIDNFDYRFRKFIINDKWDYGIKCDNSGEWYVFNTNYLEEMLVNICKYFEINGIIVNNLNPDID